MSDEVDMTLEWLVENGGYTISYDEDGEMLFTPVPEVLKEIAPEVWANHLMRVHQEMLEYADAGLVTLEWDDEEMDFVVDFGSSD